MERDGVDATVKWKETGYIRKGSRVIDLDGSYHATVSGEVMTGAWYSGNRLVATFQMKAIGTDKLSSVPAK